MLDGGGAFIYGAADWAAPANLAGLFESCETVVLGQKEASLQPAPGICSLTQICSIVNF